MNILKYLMCVAYCQITLQIWYINLCFPTQYVNITQSPFKVKTKEIFCSTNSKNKVQLYIQTSGDGERKGWRRGSSKTEGGRKVEMGSGEGKLRWRPLKNASQICGSRKTEVTRTQRYTPRQATCPEQDTDPCGLCWQKPTRAHRHDPADTPKCVAQPSMQQ